MAYFVDLSFYSYSAGDQSAAKNVGWLQRGQGFDTAEPSEETLDSLWSFCSVSVNQTRGIHQCDLCAAPQAVYAARNGFKLLLGSSEIRVFSKEPGARSLLNAINSIESSGLILLRRSTVPISIYAAPSLLYHYVEAHQYKPPDEFLRALSDGPRPPDRDYFEQLNKLDLAWKRASGTPEHGQ
jgi:hypothetical protein